VSNERAMYAEITKTWSEPGFEHWQPKYEHPDMKRPGRWLGTREPREVRHKRPFNWALWFLCNYQRKLTPRQGGGAAPEVRSAGADTEGGSDESLAVLTAQLPRQTREHAEARHDGAAG
jgi:hypothetical protein